MGFLDQNTTVLNAVEFPVVEGYCGSIGAASAIAEGQMEDFGMFEAAIGYDFSEIAAVREGADIEALQEAGITGIVQRIVAFLTKLGAKVKALFTSFMAKIDSYMVKDSKKFVEKYEKSLAGKSFKGMKAKYAAPKDGYVWNKEYTFNLSVAAAGDSFKREEYIEKAYGALAGGGSITVKEFKEKVHDLVYGADETRENWDLSTINTIGTRLKTNSKVLADLKKTNDSLQNAIKKAISDIQKAKDKAGNAYKVDSDTDLSGVTSGVSTSKNDKGEYTNTNSTHSGTTNSSGASALQRKLGYLQEQANAEQSIIMTFCATKFNEAKWGIAQDRRVYAQAVAFRAVKGELKEDAMLAEAEGEVAQYECEAEFENMETCA